ncbi:hypothetical protein V8E36_003518 [Tilletia maclaganii]
MVEILPPQDLLLTYDVNICAPMVRYSKRAFRATCAQYDTHYTTSPMIVAKEFSRSEIAREADFSTSISERGIYHTLSDRLVEGEGGDGAGADDGMDDRLRQLKRRRILVGRRTVYAQGKIYAQGLERQVRGVLVGQLAASDSKTLADGAEILAPHVDGLDLNCGCPTSSAWSDHIGAYLLRQPELVADMVRTLKARLGASFPVCVKIRLDPELRRTETLVRNAIEAGASILAVHGRTRHQSSAGHPVDLDGIRFAIDIARRHGNRSACGATSAIHTASAHDAPDAPTLTSGLADGGGGAGGAMPCIANGDVFTLAESREWRRRTGAQGVMSARGLLANPALFAGYDATPPDAVQYFCKQALRGGGLPYQIFHRHVAYMLESALPRSDSVYFNSLSSTAAVVDWLQDEGWWWKG